MPDFCETVGLSVTGARDNAQQPRGLIQVQARDWPGARGSRPVW